MNSLKQGTISKLLLFTLRLLSLTLQIPLFIGKKKVTPKLGFVGLVNHYVYQNAFFIYF
jgi:hypothetical protein